MKKLVGVVFILTFCLWVGIRIVAGIQFNRNCDGYLKRAADANTVELAAKQIKVALDYMERQELVSGYTSIIYKTPDEDVGFWHENIKSSFAELKRMDPDASQLERTNVLMKLRETLLDQDDGGKTSVTAPDGISIYPYNSAMAFFGSMSLILAIIGACLVFLED